MTWKLQTSTSPAWANFAGDFFGLHADLDQNDFADKLSEVLVDWGCFYRFDDIDAYLIFNEYEDFLQFKLTWE
jgi:hypothetical protein